MEIKPFITDDFVIVQETESISEMIGKLKQFEKRSALVFRKDTYLGLVEKKRLLRSRLDASEAKVKHYVMRAPILNEHADVVETAYLMYQSSLDFMPVERNKCIIGVLQALDVAQLGVGLPEAHAWKVTDVKLLKPKILRKDDPVATAIDLMHDEHIDQVPIFEQGKLWGIISYRDLFRKYLNWSPRRDISAKFNRMLSTRGGQGEMPHLSSLPVQDFSSNDNLVTVLTKNSLREAVQLMTKHNITSLPVVENGKLRGLLTVKNVLGAIASLKIPKRFNIRFVGLSSLHIEPYHKYAVQKIAANESFKLQRQVHQEFDLIIHIKAHKKEGNRQQFVVNLRIEYPGKMMTSSQQDWDLETALRKAFNGAMNEAGSKFRKEKRRILQ